MRATSRGYVKLKTANPYDHPIIDPNYLATEEDRVELRESIRLTREVFSQKAFDPFRGRELQPGELGSSSQLCLLVWGCDFRGVGGGGKTRSLR